MKQKCERCQKSLSVQEDAYICSYECTYCPTCSAVMQAVCPNCSGELVRRPRRKTNPVTENKGYSV